MNGGGYLKFLATMLVLLVAVLGYFGVTALDRARAVNLKVLDRLERLEVAVARLETRRPESAAAAGSAAGASASGGRAAPESGIANREYYDPAAVPGGRIIQALGNEPPNLNPIICNEATAAALYGLCNAALAERDWAHPEQFRPMLAESWSISPDHLSYRIRLRRGVRWQDVTDPVTGREFRNVEVTARDFQFALEVIRDPAVNCAPLRVYYQDLDRIVVVNDYEFVVHWKEARYGTLSSTLGMTPLPRHFYDYGGRFDGRAFNDDHRRNRMIVGCGPYRLVKWERDRRLVFERNPDYFGAALGIAPAIQTLVFEVIRHPNTRFQALLSGGIDWMGLTPDQWRNRTGGAEFREGVLRKYHYLLPQYTYIGYNQKNPLFQDARVRRALTMLIDRERIRRDLYRGLAVVAVGPFFPGGGYADPELKPWPFDLAAARKLLADAGWRDTDGDGVLEKNGRKFEFTMLQVASHPLQERLMPMLKEYFAAAGIDMRLQTVEWSVYIERLDQRAYDACCLGWSSGFDSDLYQVWHSSQTAAGGSNHIGYRNPALDRLIESMRIAFEPERRIELARRIGRLLHEEQPYTFLFWPESLVALSGRYRNVRVFPVGIPTEIIWTPRDRQLAVP